jgi:DnaK suppressor protein
LSIEVNPTPSGSARKLEGFFDNVALMDSERARELLARERERIERGLARLGHQDTGEPADEIDPANQAADLYGDELEEGLADDLREQLAAVERAEARLAAGTYGRSIESGEPIPDERLEALPTAERTTEEEAH